MKFEMNECIETFLITDQSVMSPKLMHKTLRKHILTVDHLNIINMFTIYIYMSNHNYVFLHIKS